MTGNKRKRIYSSILLELPCSLNYSVVALLHPLCPLIYKDKSPDTGWDSVSGL
jgi:hypothetical protein